MNWKILHLDVLVVLMISEDGLVSVKYMLPNALKLRTKDRQIFKY
ncbi:MAG: hypothetical protein QW511_01775 [Candidatus Methanomethylicia archaeon]